MEEIKNLLPIGSIVLLKNAKKRLMICGIRQSEKENSEKEYDYMGVIYPEGHIGSEYSFLFNHEDIDRILFRGFEDIERQKFIERLSKFYQNNGTEDM